MTTQEMLENARLEWRKASYFAKRSRQAEAAGKRALSNALVFRSWKHIENAAQWERLFFQSGGQL